MRRLWNIVITLILCLSVAGAGVAAAQDFQKGLRAYKKGNYAKALKEWRPLAERGNADAQYNLGWMYDRGWGVKQDNAEAVKWYSKAAEQGDPDAENMLGQMYHDGRGVKQDKVEAASWYRKAAEQGNEHGQHNLGTMYYFGWGVGRDLVLTYMWWGLAASKGNKAASRKVQNLSYEMTPAQIAEAKRKAKRCMASGYKDCD